MVILTGAFEGYCESFNSFWLGIHRPRQSDMDRVRVIERELNDLLICISPEYPHLLSMNRKCVSPFWHACDEGSKCSFWQTPERPQSLPGNHYHPKVWTKVPGLSPHNYATMMVSKGSRPDRKRTKSRSKG